VPNHSLKVVCLALALVMARPALAMPAHFAQLDTEEMPPRPEPPYPSDEPLRAELSNDLRQDANPEPEEKIERPYKIDEEGNYFYDTKSTPSAPKGHPDVVQPESAHADGAYIYDKHVSPPSFSGTPGIEAPVQTLPSGEFRYKIPPSKSTHAASFRFGAMTSLQLQNKYNSKTFSDIYGGNPLPVLVGDYEWKRLITPVGRISIKLNSGIAVANGPGQWKTARADPNDVPDERYTFMLFPNAVTAHFRFQFWEKQIFVPFIEGGGGYYTVMELRDDGAKPRIGGGLVGLGGGGLYILMDWADPQSIRELSNEYGINHVWLALEGRGALSLGSSLDFTSFEGGVGFMMEF